MKKWGKSLGSVVLLGLVAGCSSASASAVQTITVQTGTQTYMTKEITIEKGKTYKLVLDNKDVQVHDFSIDKIPVKITHAAADHHAMDMSGPMPALHVSAEANKTEEVEFVANQAGSYQFYCTVPGHKESGMVGTLIVK